MIDSPSHDSTNETTIPEWSYLQDDLGVVYCLGRAIKPEQHEATAVYYKTDRDLATKQTLAGDAHYRRFIYQGLPEERERLVGVERQRVADRLVGLTSLTGVGITLETDQLKPHSPDYTKIINWLSSSHPRAGAFQNSLGIACDVLSETGIDPTDLSLYGAASFGLVGTTDKVVDDIDVLFSMSNLPELREVIAQLGTDYSWADIDPYDRLSERRRLLKAKRWSTSQVRLNYPQPLSIDCKVYRQAGDYSLWNELTNHDHKTRYNEDLRVIDDTEGLCTSPALRCEDKSGHERVLLLEGYQYIGTAVKGDTVSVRGNLFEDSSVILVTQNEHDGLLPDFSNVPIA